MAKFDPPSDPFGKETEYTQCVKCHGVYNVNDMVEYSGHYEKDYLCQDCNAEVKKEEEENPEDWVD